MTLNDLECPIRLNVRLVDVTLDVRLLPWRFSDSTIRIDVPEGEEESGLKGLAPTPRLCGQLTRCFSAVAELLVHCVVSVSVLCHVEPYRVTVSIRGSMCFKSQH